MTAERADPLDRAGHRRVAIALFNHTWTLLERRERTEDEALEMLHAAHASGFHWSRAGTPRNRSIAEWQVSRVYAVLGRPEPARFHGQVALDLATTHHLAPFYVGAAHEALARAAAIAGDKEGRERHLRAARGLARRVRGREDAALLRADLASVPRVALRGRPTRGRRSSRPPSPD